MKLVCESLKELFEAQSRDDVIQDLGAEQEEWKHKILSQIKKIKPGETQSWRVIPFPRLKKIWNDFINTGIVRDTAGIDLFEKIITENTCKIWINNYLIGATPLAEYEDDLEEYGITAEEYELYNDWMCDEEGVDRTSDYGITPIHKLLIEWQGHFY